MDYINFLSLFLPQILQDSIEVAPETILKTCNFALPKIIENTTPIYRLQNDTIYMPPINHYENSSEYYRVLFHELAHSTAHINRIGRKLSTNNRSYQYAIEELIAEFSSILLCNATGILNSTLPLHYEYVNAWYNALWFFSFGRRIKKDIKHCVFEAEKVYQYVLA